MAGPRQPPPARVNAIPPASVPTRWYQADPYRPERVRAVMGFRLLWLVGLTIGFVALQVARGYWEQTREFAEIIMPAELAVLGSAVAFYFTRPEHD